MPHRNTACVALVGDASQLISDHGCLDGRAEQTETFAAVAAFIAASESRRNFALVVVCQTWPDQFSEAEIGELIAAVPLTRLLCVQGPWCESENRTRGKWPQAVRVPLWAARSRIPRELEAYEQGKPPLPLTASPGEVFLHGWSPPSPPLLSETDRIAVESSDRACRDCLVQLVMLLGGTCVSPENADLILRDRDFPSPGNSKIAPTIELTDSVTAETDSHVLSKLAPLEALQEAIVQRLGCVERTR